VRTSSRRSPPYRPDGITAAPSEANLRAKLEDGSFRGDLNALVATWPSGYDTDEAAELVIAEVLSLCDSANRRRSVKLAQRGAR
jgi:hypothetical protein